MPFADNLEPWQQVDLYVQRFELAWQRGDDRPQIDDFLPLNLPPRDPLRLAVLKGLVEVDQSRRHQLKSPLGLDKYVMEYPELVDAYVQAFQSEWDKGGQPTLDRFLPEPKPHNDLFRLAVLKDLVRVDKDKRQQAGQQVCRDEYLKRYPELDGSLSELTEIYGLPAPSPLPKVFPEKIGRYPIERFLGQGTFGIVYQGFDEELERHVAIKVPRQELVSRPEVIAEYRKEAQIVAGFRHPNIVTVFDVGARENFFIVCDYIKGGTLKQWIENNRLTMHHAAELVATVAETLHYAHNLLVHRDIKPANILLEWPDGEDNLPVPYVADFGLALKVDDVGRGNRFAGTPAYMSPEQARGEGHRVEGRSDIFSLGIVFYELLTGERPFRGDTAHEVLDQIINIDARPPRQLVKIDKELERICLKALAKRAVERYTTAQDMADDLRHFLKKSKPDDKLLPPAPAKQQDQTPRPDIGSAPPPLKIRPKGLRSFDVNDKDFFLELLPGPRDRDGLPDSIRFWKTHIEERDLDNTFAVGLMYGPSGCGKSSFVRAGLLPSLQDVSAVYVEATADETEVRLLHGLRKGFPSLDTSLGLRKTLANLRQGHIIPAGKKLLIILDQFEQWLHATPARGDSNTELIEALRQCDGGRVQCIIMVRDDFWLAVSRFLKELEVRLVEGENSALVDLFDMHHARKVLAAFGRAYEKLPENPAENSMVQTQFVEQAVANLAQDGKVICVRLAVFAEMMKGKPWTPASLKQVGGVIGIGETFLEETFSAATAPPAHREHQQAAREVLKALLPAAGADIKGHMKSNQHLQAVSGYGNRPEDFKALLDILDKELRLITPTDPEGDREAGRQGVKDREQGDKAAAPNADAVARYYQLTHDYMVHSLRSWLTRKQRETRVGRAELLLAESAVDWNARPNKRLLPSFLQWLQIRCLAKKAKWTLPERKMMRAASRYHGLRGAVAAMVLFLLSLAGWEGICRLKAAYLLDNLVKVNITNVPDVVAEMAPYRRLLDEPLRNAIGKDNNPDNDLRRRLALLPVDPGQVNYLYPRLLEAAQPNEFVVIRKQLQQYEESLAKDLWKDLEDSGTNPDRRLLVYAALAAYDPNNKDWENVRDDAIELLSAQKPADIAQWTDTLKDISDWLISMLDEPRNPPKDKVAWAKKQANVGVALIVMGRGEKVWKLFEHRQDPTLRSFLIERMGPGGVPAEVLIKQFHLEKDDSVKRAILLSLGGEFGQTHFSKAERDRFLPVVKELFGADDDPGIHGAAEWLLRRWHEDEWLLEQILGWANDKQQREKVLSRIKQVREDPVGNAKRRWYVNGQNQTMIVLLPTGIFQRGEKQARYQIEIDRAFAIGSKEVTLKQFNDFRLGLFPNNNNARRMDLPVTNVTWYEAAEYCNWLSRQEGLPDEELCYESNAAGKFDVGMKMAKDYLHRKGYRLPTDAEWEYACRAGAETMFSFGNAEAVLAKYAWYIGNSSSQLHPVGELKPNDFGLSDMHGNVREWTQDASERQFGLEKGKAAKDAEIIQDTKEINNGKNRVVRGGSYESLAESSSASSCPGYGPATQMRSCGFRVAKTIAP